ncbi:hypothetical protein [Nannocystis pusilla]|uniref:hypothetical protein n=1 Tax=Nannocystis pusilla TaxID=889268 RepID=UPI003B7B2301
MEASSRVSANEGEALMGIMRGLLVLIGMTWLVGCPWPCPRGTTTNGGGQCLPLEIPAPDLAVINGTTEQISVSVRVSERPLFCSAIGPEEAPAVLATLFSPVDGGSVPERYARATWSGELERDKSWDFETEARCIALRIWVGGSHESHDLIVRTNTVLTIVPASEPGTYAIRGADEVHSALPQICPTTMHDRELIPLGMLVSRPGLSLGEPSGPPCLLGQVLVRPVILQTSTVEATAVVPGTTRPPYPGCPNCPAEYTLFGGARMLVPPRISGNSPPRSDNDEHLFFDVALAQGNGVTAPPQ